MKKEEMTETMKTSWAKLNDKSNQKHAHTHKNFNEREYARTHTNADDAKWSKAQNKTKQSLTKTKAKGQS